MLQTVGDDDVTVGRHQFDGQQGVDGQAVLAHQVADASAQRQAADADGGGIAEADDQAVLLDGTGHLTGGEAGPGPHGARLGVDVDAVEVTQVQHQSTMARRVAADAVAAGTHRKLEDRGAGEVEHRGHVGVEAVGVGDA